MLRYPQSRPLRPRQKTDHEQKHCSPAEQMQRIPPDKKKWTACYSQQCACPQLPTSLENQTAKRNESDKVD